MGIDSGAAIRVRLRPDLIAVRIPTDRGTEWNLKDPISLQFFLFDEHEFGLLQMLDGRVSVAELLDRFRTRYAPSYLSGPQLISFLDEARKKGLLLIDAGLSPHTTGLNDTSHGLASPRPLTQTEPLLPRLLKWMNLLSLRLPGLDPDRGLDLVYPFVRWAFTRTATLLGALLVLLALGLLLLRFDRFLAAIPEQQAFLTPQTWLWLAVAIGLTKVLHELAHALTCKHFGGDCHELGLMFLVFVPCLYCNVSDSWLLARRRERMLITAAGIWMELLLASVATLVWWFAVDGPLRMVALSVMLVGFVSTLLLNGNPLMRYDGYYLLSDYLQIPNLGAESSRVLRETWRRRGLGIDSTTPSRSTERRLVLATYGIASFCYRLLVVSLILVAVQALGRATQMRFLANLVSCITLLGLMLPLLNAITAPLASRLERRRIRPAHLTVALSILGGLIAAGLLIPLPRSISAPLVIGADRAERLFVTSSGTLTFALPAGTRVVTGQTVGCLENAELDRRITALEARQQRLQAQFESLNAQRRTTPAAAAQIPAVEELIADAVEQLSLLRENQSRLTLLAPSSGVVLAPPNVPRRAVTQGELPHWTGSPLDPENLGCSIDSGTLFCLVGEPADVTATLYLDEADHDSVRNGQIVTLLLDSAATSTLSATVSDISDEPVDVIPRELAARQTLTVDPQSGDAPRPLETLFRVRVAMNRDSESLPGIGECGTAKIRVAPEPALSRLWRAIGRTFHFGQ